MKPARRSTASQLLQVTLWVLLALFLATFVSYLVIGIVLPEAVTPAVDYDGSTLVRVKEDWTDRDSVAFVVRKQLSSHERSEFLAKWARLNPRFTGPNLTEMVGFDRPINDVAAVKSLLFVECRLGVYMPVDESCLDSQERLVHYVSSNGRKARDISADSTVDKIAKMLCEPSPDAISTLHR